MYQINFLLLKNILLVIYFFVSVACQEENNLDEGDKAVVVRIDDHILYQSELDQLTVGIQDSTEKIQITNNYIRKWTLEKLMIIEALVTPSYNAKNIEEKLTAYKNELITQDFIEKKVTKSLNKNIDEDDIKAYYDQNRHYFVLNHHIVQGRFIVFPTKSPNHKIIKPLIFSSKVENLRKLETYCKKYATHYWLDNNQWFMWDDILRISNYQPISNKYRLLTGNKFIYTRGLKHTYYFKIDSYKPAKSIAPLEFVKEKIAMLLLHKKKQALIKEIEDEILDKAKKNDKYKIHTY